MHHDSNLTRPGKRLSQYVSRSWRQDIDGNEEDTLPANKLQPPLVRVKDVPSLVMESDLATFGDQVGHRDYGTVHLRVLNSKIESLNMFSSMDNINLAKVRGEVPGGALVVQTFPLPIRFTDAVQRDCLFAVSDSGLRT